ncbi:hypothetical protein HPP92_018503 [Vanilla planifolia]|uniref:Uncharacterized protein n=1 Tax=Vanilla planifolia TaxID=51239 RepID=A0A835UQ16_VANPL|nr:hypothetical protein HPP92_019126 [Vanilla planifolia]KAG0469175.1 hypothetical protein HPP92_018503 [Vanilla planifolia]
MRRERAEEEQYHTDAQFRLSAFGSSLFNRMPARKQRSQVSSFASSSAQSAKETERRGQEVNPLLNYYLHEEEPEMIKEVGRLKRIEVQEEDDENFYVSSDGMSMSS